MAPEAGPLRVLDTATVVREFGNPGAYLQADGTVSPRWESDTLSVVTFPEPLVMHFDRGTYATVTKARVHKRVATLFGIALAQIHAAGLWVFLNDFGGTYAWRSVRKEPRSLSRHAWGLAADFNTVNNPLGRPPRMDARIVECFAACGFAWGGHFQRRKDGMHFEFADLTKLTPGGAA